MLCLALTVAVSMSLRPAPRVVRYDVDAGHSNVGFSIGFMGLGRVRGTFSDFQGTVMYVPAAPEQSTVSFAIAASSIDTDNNTRDRDLRAEPFFNVEQYPYILFTSKSITRRGTRFLVRGAFTMRGITRDITIPMTVPHPEMADGWGNRRIGFEGTITINRRDYNVIGPQFWNQRLDPSRIAVGDSVKIELEVSATIPNTDRWTFPQIAGKSSIAEVMWNTIPVAGADSAIALYQGLKRTDAAKWNFGEGQLNSLGYKLLYKQPRDAVKVFRLNTEAYPASSNTWDSYAEALAAAGDTAQSVAMYRKVLQMDSTSVTAIEMLRWLGRK